jgi:hypothetical protein
MTVQQQRQRAAFLAIQRGEIIVKYRCGHCQGVSLQSEELTREERRDGRKQNLLCLSCGRLTSVATAKRVRKLEIGRIIERGVDVPGLTSAA